MTTTDSFPWLADLDQLIPDKAMDPVDEYDTRDSVPELLTEHASNIELVKEALKDDPLYVPSKHDDLWILRYLLSHKQKVKKATKAAKHALEFRNKHNLDAKDIRSVAPHKVQFGEDETPFGGSDSMKRSWKIRHGGDSLVCTLPDERRGVCAFMRFKGMRNDKGILKELSDEDAASTFMYVSEWSFQWVDYITRKTGRLTKSARFGDMDGFSIFGVSREVKKRDGKIMGDMEDVYPQLLQSVFVYNVPSLVHTIWVTFRPLLPSRVVEKVDFIEPKTNKKEVSRLLRFMSKEQLPVSLGGNNPVNPVEW